MSKGKIYPYSLLWTKYGMFCASYKSLCAALIISAAYNVH